MPFDLRRPGVIESQPPVRDIAVVPDPVHQLAAAGVVVPAPVLINAHRRCTAPSSTARATCRSRSPRADRDTARSQAGVPGTICAGLSGLSGKRSQLLHQRRQRVPENHDARPAGPPRRASRRQSARCARSPPPCGNEGSDLCHEPVCQMTLFFSTARTIACCSAIVRASGFSP